MLNASKIITTVIFIIALPLSAMALIPANQINANDPQAPNISSTDLAAELYTYNQPAGGGSAIKAADAGAGITNINGLAGMAKIPGMSSMGNSAALAQVMGKATMARMAPANVPSVTGAAYVPPAADQSTSPHSSLPVDPSDATQAAKLMGSADKNGNRITSIILNTSQGHINVVDSQGPYAAKIQPIPLAVASLTVRANNANAAQYTGYAPDNVAPPVAGVNPTLQTITNAPTNVVTKSACDMANPNGINPAFGGKIQGDCGK